MILTKEQSGEIYTYGHGDDGGVDVSRQAVDDSIPPCKNVERLSGLRLYIL